MQRKNEYLEWWRARICGTTRKEPIQNEDGMESDFATTEFWMGTFFLPAFVTRIWLIHSILHNLYSNRTIRHYGLGIRNTCGLVRIRATIACWTDETSGLFSNWTKRMSSALGKALYLFVNGSDYQGAWNGEVGVSQVVLWIGSEETW